MTYTYLSICREYGNAKTYGIGAAEFYDGRAFLIESFVDICSDPDKIEKLVKLCNDLELDVYHLHDVIDDFLLSI